MTAITNPMSLYLIGATMVNDDGLFALTDPEVIRAYGTQAYNRVIEAEEYHAGVDLVESISNALREKHPWIVTRDTLATFEVYLSRVPDDAEAVPAELGTLMSGVATYGPTPLPELDARLVPDVMPTLIVEDINKLLTKVGATADGSFVVKCLSPSYGLADGTFDTLGAAVAHIQAHAQQGEAKRN